MRCAMPCSNCSFYSFPKSECRFSPPAAVGRFAKVEESDWCAKHERDADMLEARRLLGLRNRDGKNAMVDGRMEYVPGPPYTDEELADLKERADKLIADRRKG